MDKTNSSVNNKLIAYNTAFLYYCMEYGTNDNNMYYVKTIN